MPDAAKTGIIFLSVGFFFYLAWKNELNTYIGFATSGALSTGGSTAVPTTTTASSSSSSSSSSTLGTLGNIAALAALA